MRNIFERRMRIVETRRCKNSLFKIFGRYGM
jgi:hypothetical protein